MYSREMAQDVGCLMCRVVDMYRMVCMCTRTASQPSNILHDRMCDFHFQYDEGATYEQHQASKIMAPGKGLDDPPGHTLCNKKHDFTTHAKKYLNFSYA